MQDTNLIKIYGYNNISRELKNIFKFYCSQVNLIAQTNLKLSYLHMEVSQRPGKVEEPPGHRWAGILGAGVALVTLTLPLVMITSYSPFSSNAEPIPKTIYQQGNKINPMK